MKSSTVFALFAGIVPVVAAVVLVQLWPPGSEAEPVEPSVASGEPADAPGAADPSSLETYSGKWYSASGPDEERAGAKASSGESSEDGADNQGESLISQSRAMPATSIRQTNAAAISVTGDVGSLTFEPERSTRTALPDIKATSVSVMGDGGEVLEFSSEHGQPVIVTSNLDDGFYKWEAVHQPELNPRVDEELSAAREAGDFQAERQLKREYRRQGLLPTEEEAEANVQSGTFRVLNGQMVDKDAAEAGLN